MLYEVITDALVREHGQQQGDQDQENPDEQDRTFAWFGFDGHRIRSFMPQPIATSTTGACAFCRPMGEKF